MESNLIQNVSGTVPQCGIDIEANPVDSDVANHDLVIAGNSFVACSARPKSDINELQHPTNVGVYSNSFIDCPTGVNNSGVNSAIDNNTFHGYVNPAGGAAIAQIYFGTATGQSAQVTGNNFYSITGMSAIVVGSTWTGQVLIASNRISGFSGSGINLIEAQSNATITGNNLPERLPGEAINVTGNSADIENNTLNAGDSYGILTVGFGQTIRNNSLVSFPTAIYVSDPTPGSTSLTTVNGNTVVNCPTGVRDATAVSQIENNAFSNASVPSSGAGAGALGQVYLVGFAATTAQISGNSFSSLTNLSAVYVLNTWSGRATISNNQINNLSGSAVWWEEFSSARTTLPLPATCFKTLRAEALGSAANNADIEYNTIPAGAGDGIYVQGNSGTLRHNSVGGHPVGIEVTDPATGGNASLTTTVDSNTITNCPTAVRDTTTGSAVTNNKSAVRDAARFRPARMPSARSTFSASATPTRW